MEIVTGAMSTLLPKLGTLLTDEYKLQKGVRGDIKYLKEELESMNAALEEVSRVPADQLGKQAKIWARQVKEMSYDIEDSIDAFMVPQPTDVHFFRRFIDMIPGFLRKARARRQIAKDTMAIKSHARIPGMYREAAELVGIDGPTEDLEKLLMEEDSAPKVIAIVGVGGLGKTTLAYSLYGKLEGEFHCKAFVTVSQKPDQKNILASILRQVSGQKDRNTDSWPVTEIIDEIKQFLQDKRYFIIVDDIWDPKSWDLISCSSRVDSIWRILSPAFYSYYDMPPHLKSCLLYLSMFPKGYEIEREDLILGWIGEGFVRPVQDDDDLYEVGETYFTELINRSMIMPVDVDYNGRAEACRVHDMVLDLITSLSAEENFVTILSSEQPSTLPDKKIRRLSLHSGENAIVIPQLAKSLSHARSVTVFDIHGIDNISRLTVDIRLSSLQFLRVLYVNVWGFRNKYIKDIGKLLHLRHLRLRGYEITELPKEIGNLRFLQTLDTRDTYVTELPPSIAQLRQLVRLFVPWSVKLPKGIGSIKSLQVLSHVDVGVSPELVGELGNLTNLRVLEIYAFKWDERLEKVLAQCISNMHRLKVLDLGMYQYPVHFLYGTWSVPPHVQKFRCASYFSMLPGWISSLSYLSSLEIILKTLRLKDIKMLGELPSLQFLYLRTSEAPKDRVVVETGTFQCLTELVIGPFAFQCVTGGLMFAPGSAQRLQRLELSYLALRETIDKFGGVDIGVGNLTSLKRIAVRIGCVRATAGEVEETEAMIRNACGTLPNRPSPEITRINYEYMWTDQELEEESEEVSTQATTDEELEEESEPVQKRRGE